MQCSLYLFLRLLIRIVYSVFNVLWNSSREFLWPVEGPCGLHARASFWPRGDSFLFRALAIKAQLHCPIHFYWPLRLFFDIFLLICLLTKTARHRPGCRATWGYALLSTLVLLRYQTLCSIHSCSTVEMRGLEPLTPALQRQCSPN